MTARHWCCDMMGLCLELQRESMTVVGMVMSGTLIGKLGLLTSFISRDDQNNRHFRCVRVLKRW